MSPIRIKRAFIFKLVIAIPVLWFSVIGMTVVFTGGGGIGGTLPDAHDANSVYKRNSDNAADGDGKRLLEVLAQTKHPIRLKHEQPVIEEPNLDKLRFEEKVDRDMANKLRRDGRRFHNHPKMPGDEEGLRDQVGQPDILKTTTVDPKAPGEMGKAVIIDKKRLNVTARKLYDLGWQRNAFNQYASDMISLHRSLPDVRDEECKSVKYPSVLPDTSVVIIFHNEAESVLRRTVFSVFDRSPKQLIREVILVDDYSDFDHLKQPLEDFAANTPKVRLVRNPKREGLIRARLRGAAVATGDVLTFLDSHCECAKGWLEPLLARIAENYTHVMTPVIDVVNDENLQYQYSSAKSTSVGGFDWNLQFNWHGIPDHERKRRKSEIDPVRSPTMAGGLFAISRKYFEHLGTYDPGMDIWGGENLELSFRVWMCGGTLEIAPCSHVGHIFRKRSPYSWKTGVNVVKKNSVRLAEVWMDDYKKYYYERFNYDLGDFGDVSARKALRKRINCKSFDWYIKNIYPQLFIPGEAVASGEVRSKAAPAGKFMCLDSAVDKNALSKHQPISMWPCHNMGGNQVRNNAQAMCLDSAVEDDVLNKHEPIKMWPCHNQGGNQFWMLSKSGEIRRDEGCMDYAGQYVMIYPCHNMRGNQEWKYGPDNTIQHVNTKLCIELTADGQKMEMKPCSGIDRQIWRWKRKKPDSEMKPGNTNRLGVLR